MNIDDIGRISNDAWNSYRVLRYCFKLIMKLVKRNLKENQEDPTLMHSIRESCNRVSYGRINNVEFQEAIRDFIDKYCRQREWRNLGLHGSFARKCIFKATRCYIGEPSVAFSFHNEAAGEAGSPDPESLIAVATSPCHFFHLNSMLIGQGFSDSDRSRRHVKASNRAFHSLLRLSLDLECSTIKFIPAELCLYCVNLRIWNFRNSFSALEILVLQFGPRSLTIPSSVLLLGNGCFRDVWNLRRLHFKGQILRWLSMTLEIAIH